MTSFLVVQDAFEKSLSLACEECGALSFHVVWIERDRLTDEKIEAVCEECLHRMVLALPCDPLGITQ